MNTDSTDFFSGNTALHAKQDQKKRQKAALKLNVQLVDPAANSGKINDYDVSLTECSCIDFSRRHLPCKHMYRLAHELGILVLEGEVLNDPSLHNCYYIKTERDSLKTTISTLPEKSQEILQECVSLYDRFFPIKLQPYIDKLVEAGFVVSRPITFTDISGNFTIADILNMCTDEKPPKKGRRDPVIKFFVEHYPEQAKRTVRELYGDSNVYVEPTAIIETNLVVVQRFLAKKLGTIYRNLDYDENLKCLVEGIIRITHNE